MNYAEYERRQVILNKLTLLLLKRSGRHATVADALEERLGPIIVEFTKRDLEATEDDNREHSAR